MTTVRMESDADRPRIAAVHRAAFGQAAEARLVDALRASPGWHPELSLVAVVDRRVVGHVCLTDVELDTADGSRTALALGPLGVAPASQGAGVGTALVRAALAAAAAATPERLVLVLGEPAYYGRFGFVPSTDLGVVDPFGTGGTHYRALALPGAAPVPGGRVRYPPPWRAV